MKCTCDIQTLMVSGCQCGSLGKIQLKEEIKCKVSDLIAGDRFKFVDDPKCLIFTNVKTFKQTTVNVESFGEAKFVHIDEKFMIWSTFNDADVVKLLS